MGDHSYRTKKTNGVGVTKTEAINVTRDENDVRFLVGIAYYASAP